ncbi:hypothetical protein [Snuella sedimenti]|uniref:Uncharacterized protein n=1 Tax=Snuella sedimenti TaxID=2798802 RepID=A0A8J7LTB3_9FLAO|nr:hypothetical protein [Snuella sedimenti]MBJ6368136.1 hypothetical protein [Snuella sedimenti]
MTEISSINFNKIFVIESLDSTEEKETGKELYDDLLRWKEIQLGAPFKAELIQVKNRIQFFESLKKIKNECKNNSVYPIIHFEIHGNKSGLSLVSNEFIEWIELYKNLITINSIIGNNLFLTLAVCKGAYLMELIKLANPAPFWGFIGSFDKINSEDILIRYNEFYKEFLDSFNISKAFYKLQNANSQFPSTYRFINSETTFKEVYTNYLKENTSQEGLKKRVKQVQVDEKLKFNSRPDKRRFEKDFKKRVLATKNDYYQKHSKIFFMIDKFPENRERFNIKKNL